jgi:hypothetical protein
LLPALSGVRARRVNWSAPSVWILSITLHSSLHRVIKYRFGRLWFIITVDTLIFKSPFGNHTRISVGSLSITSNTFVKVSPWNNGIWGNLGSIVCEEISSESIITSRIEDWIFRIASKSVFISSISEFGWVNSVA